jgi:hypothetical protein
MCSRPLSNTQWKRRSDDPLSESAIIEAVASFARPEGRGPLKGPGAEGPGGCEKKQLDRGDGAGIVSSWRLHISREAVRKKRNERGGRG